MYVYVLFNSRVGGAPLLISGGEKRLAIFRLPSPNMCARSINKKILKNKINDNTCREGPPPGPDRRRYRRSYILIE